MIVRWRTGLRSWGSAVDSPAMPRRTRIKLWVGNAPKNISARYAPKPLRMNQPKGETRLLETARPRGVLRHSASRRYMAARFSARVRHMDYSPRFG